MTTTQGTQAPQFIPFEKVKEYVDADIPIVPLKANGDPHTFYLYENEAEKNSLASNLSENIKKHVYSGEYIQELKLLNQQIPATFWTDKRIRDQQWYGIGCKTGLTAIGSQSDPNKVLLIIAVDADDQKPKIIKQYGLLENTLVQNTPHGGMHVVFAMILTLYFSERQIQSLSIEVETKVLNDLVSINPNINKVYIASAFGE